MAFRRDGARFLRWREWVAKHRDTLVAIGLPDWLYADERRWISLLQEGGLDSETRWSVDMLSPKNPEKLCSFLVSEYGADQQGAVSAHWGWSRAPKGSRGPGSWEATAQPPPSFGRAIWIFKLREPGVTSLVKFRDASPAGHMTRRACRRRPARDDRCGCSATAPASGPASRRRGRWRKSG